MLDSVLLILVLELLHLYRVGFVTKYALSSGSISESLPPLAARKQVRVRAVLQMVVADFPARCDCFKVKRSGEHPCAKCKKKGFKSGRRWLYGGTRKDVRDGGCESKSEEAVLEAGKEHLLAVGNKAARERIGRETGVTGFCFLSLLKPVFGFDVVRDNVGDWMHKGPENLIKNLLLDTLMNPKKKPPNSLVAEAERTPLNGPFIPEAAFGDRLSRFVWSRDVKAGRVPESPAKKPLGW